MTRSIRNPLPGKLNALAVFAAWACIALIVAQGFARPPYGDWSSVTAKWFSGSVVCIHCGERVDT